MKHRGKTLVDRLYGSVKKAACLMGVVGASYLSPFMQSSYSQEPVKITETESFSGSITKSNIRDPVAKWNVGASELEAVDYDETTGDGKKSGWGYFHFNDKTYSFTEASSLCIEADARKSLWGSSADWVGKVFAGSPTDGTYYMFLVNAAQNANNSQFSIQRQSPGWNLTYEGGVDNVNIIKGGTNKLIVSYDNQGWHFKINSVEVWNDKDGLIPPLSGFTGMAYWDSMGANDPAFSSTTYFDNEKAVYNAPGGGGDVNDPSKPFFPGFFKRGDFNKDKEVSFHDAIATLNYLFRDNNSFRCHDAADANDDGSVDVSDVVRILFHQFVGGGAYRIPPPYDGVKEVEYAGQMVFGGMDLTVDNLDCQNDPAF